MKLIYAQGACSLSVHILMHELGLNFQSLKVSLKDKKVLESYNPRSYVPALILEGGTLMTEAASLLQYLAVKYDSPFIPKDEFQRAKCTEWLIFISSELHKGLGAYFHPEGMKEDFLKESKARLYKRLDVLNEHLMKNKFMLTDYSIVDMYALAILRICENVRVDFSPFKAISEYKDRLEERPLIKKVLAEEKSAPVATEIAERSINPRNSDWSRELHIH